MFALTAALLASAVAATAPVVPPQAAVRINLNAGGDYRPGDRVSVEVETGEDGYLVVFRVDGDGYVRVIFPLDPDLDPFVRGDRRYELRGRGERQSFLADDRGGTGLILAVLSRGPLDFSQYAIDTHWDYERLRLDDPAGDAEAQLLGMARRMTRDDRFDYDVAGYRVWGPGYESEQPVVIAGGGYDPYYDPSYSCLSCGRGGISISIGGHYGGWYDPWYDPWFDRWDRRYYDRYNRNWNGWYGWDPYWGTPWRPITVINTYPRPVVPQTPYGLRSRPRLPGTTTTAGGVPRLSDPVAAPRPVNPAPSGNDGRSRARGATTPAAAPRSADRAEPSRRIPTTVGTPSRGNAPTRGTTSAPPPPPPSTPPATERSRSRRPESQQLTPVVRPAVEPRRVEERPVYRPPVAAPRVERKPEPSASSRPTSSPPPRSTSRREPQRTVERSAPPQRSTPTRTVERSAPPQRSTPTRTVERSAPPQRSTPTRTVERSSPPPSPPASSGSGSSRSRSRGPN